MKRFIYSAFIAFLASAATIGILALLVPGPRRPAAEQERTIASEELARHASAGDCWLAVSGGVYDVSAYVHSHPAPRRALLEWCGKEATRAFNTKCQGRPHGEQARALLARHRLGKLAPDVAQAVEPESVIEAFSRPGCRHCVRAEDWLAELQTRRPSLRVLRHDVSRDAAAAARLARLARRDGQPGALVPSFVIQDRLVVGFRDGATTGRRLEELLDGASAAGGGEVDAAVFGRISAARSGLLVFTLAVGLVDGFNPCAMWVLLFLLSLLAHVHSRARMIAIAGTFLAVSGAVYYLFMTVWLGAFLALGESRALQAALGCLALAAAAIHLKDALVPGRGPSLGIPESAKPGIYARVREVVTARNLPAALAAACALAVGVNLVEMLCTAGLPAVYTQVLASQHLGAWQRQGYLLLYIAAYMLDDGLMTAAAVAALSATRLQERGGRILQLVSGAVLAALGLALIFRPTWLS